MSSAVADTVSLRHVIVVGGSLADWAAASVDHWAQLLSDLGKVADHVGAGWLTLRPYEPGAGSATAPDDRRVAVGSCVVSAVGEPDGRRRIAEAVRRLQARAVAITEAGIAVEMNAPADVDPDLVVVIGSGHRLPPSLVWELAYSELVFIDVPWRQLAASHLEDAITSYSQRHRRFGGVD